MTLILGCRKTALALRRGSDGVLGQQQMLLPSMAQKVAEYHRGVDLGRIQDHTAIAVTELRFSGSTPYFFVKYFHRFPLGLLWSSIVKMITNLEQKLRATSEEVSITWAVDATGSSGVVTLLREAMPNATIWSVRITRGSGMSLSYDMYEAHVAKGRLVGLLISGFESSKGYLPANSKEIENVMDELDNYEVRTNAAFRDAWMTFKFQKHDDLVTSLAHSL